MSSIVPTWTRRVSDLASPVLTLCALAAALSCHQARPPVRAHEVPQWTGEGPSLTVAVAATLEALLKDEDTNGDFKITVDDPPTQEPGRGDRRFILRDARAGAQEVRGTYALSNVLQELAFARRAGLDKAVLNPEQIYEPPATRLSRIIRTRYWDALTRRIDGPHLAAALADEKSAGNGVHYLYVSSEDPEGLGYFRGVASAHPELHLAVETLPTPIRGTRDLTSLQGRHGLLALGLTRGEAGMVGIPFVVPGGRFNEMYGWDSYFIALGLLADDRVELARGMVDNLVYEIEHYGKTLNANRTYYLTRSQPPLLTSMALAVYHHLEPGPERLRWLGRVAEAASREYHTVWLGPEHHGEPKALRETGLSRYRGLGEGPPPEVEAGHFDHVYAHFGKRWGMPGAEVEEKYLGDTLPPVRSKELDEYFVHDRCMRESGHDTTYRWHDHCADFVTVDLNALLYRVELDLSSMHHELGHPDESRVWRQRAAQRKERLRALLWDPDRALFFDFDWRLGKRSSYVSATSFYPLWAHHADDPSTRILSQSEAAQFTREALRLLEKPGGIVASTEGSRGDLFVDRSPRQWDYPIGWAPHQMLVWEALESNGFEEDAQRLIYRWLYTLVLNAAHYNGTIAEKMDVMSRSLDVRAEYGNVGTEFRYAPDGGFGWVNASIQVGFQKLKPALREQLDALVPPEQIFGGTACKPSAASN